MAYPKTTSRRIATRASGLLRKSSSRTTRSVAGSALSQKHGRRNRR